MQTRRNFLAAAGIGVARAAASRKTIVLRSGWQTVNIGDITHTPGVLRLIDRHIPEADVILWPGRELDRGVDPMLRRAFPKLQVADGDVGSQAIRDVFQRGSLLMHGSAASVGSMPQFHAWRKEAGKPYGFFGVGFPLSATAVSGAVNEGLRSLLRDSKFVFTRETASLKNLHKEEIRGPVLGFAPDGTFSFDIVDEARGKAYLKESGLDGGRFLAVIPRLRYTPYHTFRKVDWTPEETARRVAVNEKWQEIDHAKLREAIVAWVRKTGRKVLLCPEMTYQLDIIDPLLYDPLPEDVKKNVVRRKTYWLPDEAAVVYRHARLVLSCECHSPIIAAAQGTPCMYVHQPEDGIKGQMYPDLGLGDWYFEVEQATGSQIAARVLDIAARPEASQRQVRGAVAKAQKLQAEAMRSVRTALGLA